mgnify:CR=1 FL=1
MYDERKKSRKRNIQLHDKKEKEGKAKKVCKFAGLNKFLRIYYARVMESKADKKELKVA